jgi:hypothetical protein
MNENSENSGKSAIARRLKFKKETRALQPTEQENHGPSSFI